MSQVGQIGRPAGQQNVGMVAPQTGAEAPAELRGARSSAGIKALRVVLGIFSLGISEGVLALVRSARAHPAPQPREAGAGLPSARPRADVFNREIAEGLRNNTIPAAFQASVKEAIDQLRTRFGTTYIPEGATLANLPRNGELCHNIYTALRRLGEEVSPQELRAQVKQKGAQTVAAQVLQARIAACCSEVGYSAEKAGLIASSMLSNPDLAEALYACQNLEEMNRVLETHMGTIRENISLRKEISDAQEQAKASVFTSLARSTGLNEDIVRKALDLKKLEDSFGYLSTDIINGTKSLRGEALTEAFSRIADTFAERKAELFASVDRLALPQQVRDEWKESVLTQRTLSRGDMFTTWHNIGSSVEIGNSLQTVLNSPAEAFSDREILGLVETAGTKLTDALIAHYGQQAWDELGGDGQADARYYAGQAMLAAHPELMAALSARPELVGRLMTMCGDDIGASMQAQMTSSHNVAAIQQKKSAEAAQAILIGVPRPAAEYNETLAAALGKPEMPALHAHALESAVAEMRTRYGDDCLPAGDLAQALSGRDPLTGGERLSTLMAGILRGAANPVGSGDITALFEGTARSTAAYGAFQSILAGMAKDAGLDVSEEAIRRVATMLRERHPGLEMVIAGAENRTDVKAIVDTLPEATALLRVEHDIQAAWNSSVDDIYTEMTAVTGLPREDVEARLNLAPMTSGRFSYMRQDIRDLCSNPETAPEAMPSSRQIREDYQRIADDFLAGKRGLHESIDGFGISPQLAARWKEEVLTNPTLRKADFLQRSLQIARGMSDTGFPALLGEPGISDEELFGHLVSIGMQKEARSHVVYTAAELNDMGSDEYSVINSTVREAFLDLNPGLVAAMRADGERMKAMLALGEERMIEVQHQMEKVKPDSPQWAKLQADFGALGTAYGILAAVIQGE